MASTTWRDFKSLLDLPRRHPLHIPRSGYKRALVWRLLLVAEQSFRRLDAPHLLPEVALGANTPLDATSGSQQKEHKTTSNKRGR